ncbi:hypothetical protein [Amycolatopsis sp. FDAARGOS 1241]|uniref:hypothetical protein n=1 Tax=Amycolatopsis sp. FDAARGOS 1241 TaxID=2778070 RepID=UPI00194E18E7|nr:hypothetical protein [Amycolatopsis sp. FDAARGOS 1241]QRP42957.1 hypothetical protein I6J71_26285 [Amycolatopsis sp. FDAARGOS 1241]
MRTGRGFVALIGPGLTEDVDEARLTTNALWEAVTGEPGTQHRHEQVKVVDRGEKAEAERKASNERFYGAKRQRAQAAAKEPATDAQLRYLSSLVNQVSTEVFDAQFAIAVKGTGIVPRRPRETALQAVSPLTKATARTLITNPANRP